MDDVPTVQGARGGSEAPLPLSGQDGGLRHHLQARGFQADGVF